MCIASFLALLFFLKGCAAQPIQRETPAACRSLYVVSHGWHTGIVVSSGDP